MPALSTLLLYVWDRKEREFRANPILTVLFRAPRKGIRPSHAGEHEEHLFQRAGYGACPAETRGRGQFRQCMQYQFAASSSELGLVCCQQRRCECGMCPSHVLQISHLLFCDITMYAHRNTGDQGPRSGASQVQYPSQRRLPGRGRDCNVSAWLSVRIPLADFDRVPLVLGGKPDTPENRKPIQDGIPLGRWAKPRDVANAVCYLASDEADFITGIELRVDGGRSLN